MASETTKTAEPKALMEAVRIGLGNQLVTNADRDKLRHMLGVRDESPKGYRNYFVAGPCDVPSMERLRAVGFVTKDDCWRESTGVLYHATVDGAKAIGLASLPEDR